MYKRFHNSRGKSSTPFIILCTMLFCFAIFLIFQFNSDRVRQNSIEQAEFEQNAGIERGSAPDYKQQIADRQREKELEREKQLALKAEWLLKLNTAMQDSDYDGLDQVIEDMKQSSMDQVYGIQALLQVLEEAVFEFQNAELVKRLNDSNWVRCQLDLRPGDEFLDRALEMSDTKPLQTLIDAGCAHFNNRLATKKLIAHILNVDEPKRRDVFNAFASNQGLQTSALKSLLEQGQQQSIVDYLTEGVLSNDFYIGNQSLLAFSIENQYTQLTNYLLDAGAPTKGKSYGGYHALVKAIKQKDAELVEKVVNLSSSDLDDEKFARIVFDAIDSDFKTEATRILFTSNPNLINNQSIVRSLLQEGVLVTSDLEQVEFLLEQGADPNTLLSRATLLSAALDKSPTVAPEIISVLREHGAVENALEAVRLKRGIENNAECELAQTRSVDRSVFVEVDQRLVQRLSAADEEYEELPTIQRCEMGVVLCKEQGHGVDACLASISNCATTDDTLCCESEVKDSYFEARCSGMSVTEAIIWMDKFSTTYGVPTNF